MIIDFHTHCFPDELAYKAIPFLAERAGVDYYLDGTVAALKSSMRKAGIEYSVVAPIATKPAQTPKINEWACEINKDGIIAFGSVHPEYHDWYSELKKLAERRIKGIKLHPDYQEFYIDDKKVYPIY